MSRVLLEPINVTITNHNAGAIEIVVDNNDAAVTLQGRCTNLYVASESLTIRAMPVEDQPELEKPILDDPATWPAKVPDEVPTNMPPVVGEH